MTGKTLIKISPDCKVKVLDLGLAKAFAGNQGVNLSNAPTLTHSFTQSDMATQPGVILGTAACMAPEQARGKAVDKRADIGAFGCVLYAMLTGHIAFQGVDISEIFASVIKGDVKLDRLPTNLQWKYQEALPQIAPDGRGMAYSSDESGGLEAYIRQGRSDDA